MKVERDIAGFALPFAVGTAAAIYSWGMFCPLTCSSLVLAAAFVSIVILYIRQRKGQEARLRILTGIAAAAAGAVCGIRYGSISVSLPEESMLMTYAAGAGKTFECVIDRLDFSSHDTNAIIKALITGNRSEIPRHITEAFRTSGASHILALSGLHLGIVYGVIYRMASIFGNSPSAVRIRSSMTVLLCGAYTLATGAGASITRAFLFILMGEAARLTGRYKSTGSMLMTSLIIHLTLFPQEIKEIGFQLSYAAMAGIAFIFPWIKGLWPPDGDGSQREGPIRRIWNSAAMSTACQITTGPLAYMYFGTFPMHFLLTNLLAIPLTGLIIPVALMTLAMDLCGICPEILLRATEALVTALSAALSIIADM